MDLQRREALEACVFSKIWWLAIGGSDSRNAAVADRMVVAITVGCGGKVFE